MTNTYSTGNALGSTSLKDLSDNASNFDEGLNSQSPSFYDRFNNRRETYAGLEAKYADAIAGLGFYSLGDYAAGITLSSRSQTFIRSGIAYALADTVALPYTTTGDWATESGNFKVIGDSALRSDLTNAVDPAKGASLVGNAAVSVANMAALLSAPQVEARSYELRGYLAGSQKGGGVFTWSPTTPRTQHNGGTVVSPTVPFNGAQGSLAAFLAGTGETAPAALGCFVRPVGEIYGEFFGMSGAPYNDAAAFNKAAAVCAGQYVALHIAGKYDVTGAVAMTGKTTLIGHNGAKLTGNLQYTCLTFPPAADTGTPITDTDPYFMARDIWFNGGTTDFGLTVTAQFGDKFIDTCSLEGCYFQGQYGFRGVNLIGGEMSTCTFYNTICGIKQEGCTNWTYSQLRFRGAARYGFYACPNSVNPGRKGGENHKFVLCEWAVCTIGARLDRSQWASFESCLFDYCGLPVYLIGCLYAKFGKSYMGAALQQSLVDTVGYTAPPTLGTAFYATPFIDGAVVEPHSWTAIDCEYTNYTDAVTQPLINSTGYNAASPTGRFSQKIQMANCKLLATANHAASQLLAIAYCTHVDLRGTIFESFNKSTSMTDVLALNNVDEYNVVGSDTYNAYQGGVRMFSPYERETVNTVRMVTDAAGVRIQNVEGVDCLVVTGTNGERVSIYTGSTLRLISVGAVNSGGTGFRTLLVPN